MNDFLRPTKTRDEVLTPCDGRQDLFDSVDREMHYVAKAVCETCPLLEACKAYRDETYREYAGFMRGTWAGRLYGAPPERRKPRDRKRDRSREVQRDCECVDCGFTARHYGRGLCGACWARHKRGGTLAQFPARSDASAA